MTFYLIYEFAFPIGFGLLGLLCVGFAVAGFYMRKPLIYSAEIPLMGVFLFLTPMYMISLRHIIAPPYFSTLGIYLNSVLSVLYPVLAYYSLGLLRGHTVLGLRPSKVRAQIRQEDSENPPRVIGFPLLAMSVVVPRKEQAVNWDRQRVSQLIGASDLSTLRFSSCYFLPTLFLGLLIGFIAFWSWCHATQWSPVMNDFTNYVKQFKP